MENTGNKTVLVERLTDHLLETIRQDATGEVLKGMIRHGFLGFERMSEDRLAAELRLRGLSEPSDFAVPNDDEFDSLDGNETELELGDLTSRPSEKSSGFKDGLD